MSNDERFELEALRSFDPQALSAIHARYFPELFRYARFHLGEPSGAEDVAAESFTRLLEAVAKGKGPKTTLRGWLLGTASNLINEHYRTAYRRQDQLLSEGLISNGPDPAERAENAERDERIRIAMRRLTPQQQHVLSLRFGDGFSLEQTAAILRKRPNAVKALQFRALAALRRQMGEETP